MFSTRQRSAETALKPLRAIALFADLPNSVLAKFDQLMVEVTLEPGTRLTTAGEQGREAFIIAEGEAEVLIDGQPVASVGAGDIVGELALLSRQTRTATVVAKTEMRVYVLDPREFSELLTDEQTAKRIASTATDRRRALKLAS